MNACHSISIRQQNTETKASISASIPLTSQEIGDMPSTADKREKAREVVDILEEISILLVSDHALLDSFANIAHRIHNWTGRSCHYVYLGLKRA